MKKARTIYYKGNGEIDKMATFVNNNDGLMYLIFVIAMLIGCCDF